MTKLEAEALKTYIDFIASQTEYNERAVEQAEAEIKKARAKEKAARFAENYGTVGPLCELFNHQAPNVSLVTYYDPIKNCMQVDVKAWKTLTEEEKQCIEKIVKDLSERKPYPLGGFIEEGGPVDSQSVARLVRKGPYHFIDNPFYPGLNVPVKLTEEGAKLWRETFKKNFNREPVLSATSNDGVNWTPKKKAKPAPQDISIFDLWDKYVVANVYTRPSGHRYTKVLDVIDFTKKIRQLTIDETVSLMHAEPDPPHTTAGDWTAQAFLTRRPDEDIINLPKNFTL